MSQFVEGGTTTLTASGAIGRYLRVKTPTSLALAGVNEYGIGTMEYATTAAGPGTVRLRTAQGTAPFVASEAITAGAQVYAAASGKVASSGTVLIGTALEAASGDGAVLEVLPAGTNDVSGTGIPHVLRQRFSLAQVNAGATVLAAIPGIKYRIQDAAMIAIGGNAAAATTIDLLATQSASSVKLVANAVAGLTQNTLLRAGATNSTILAGGVSFVANDANTAITISKTGSDMTTATHIDVLLTYVKEF